MRATAMGLASGSGISRGVGGAQGRGQRGPYPLGGGERAVRQDIIPAFQASVRRREPPEEVGNGDGNSRISRGAALIGSMAARVVHVGGLRRKVTQA